MLSIERQNIIAEMAKKDGAIKTDDLIKRFDVSSETVRRDLLSLEKQGLLKRVYGGAVICGGTLPVKNLDKRLDDYKNLKRELSEYAAELVSEGDIIALDEGSTAIEFADVLAEKFRRLTVVTHCLDVLNRLSRAEGIDIIICGGEYLREENSFCGELTAECFSKLHVMKSFVFPASLSLSGGIMSSTDKLMRVQKPMIDIADEVIIMADSSKFEKHALYKLCPLSTTFTYVTDSNIPDVIVNLYEENGIKLIRGAKDE